VIKMLKVVMLALVVMLGSLTMTACCGANDKTLSIVFKNADERLELVNYKESVGNGGQVDVEFTIPKGYEHETMTAVIDDTWEMKYTTTFSGEFDEGYSYTVDKKISFSYFNLRRDMTLVFDMTNVTKKVFDIEIDEDLSRLATSKDGGKDVVKLKAITIDQEYQGNLMKVDEEIATGEYYINDGKIGIEYGEEVVLCYTRGDGSPEITDIYGSVGKFTNKQDIVTNGNNQFLHFEVAKRGATYYNVYSNGHANTTTRLFYIGQIVEPIKLSSNLPGYEATYGFELENNENKFAILTNRQDFASDLLTINMYRSIPATSYDANNPDMVRQLVDSGDPDDDTDDVYNVYERITKYKDDNGQKVLKSEPLLYDYYNRYDVYSMYLGDVDDIDNDIFIDNNEKSANLPTELYFSIDSTESLDNFKFKLYSYERQEYLEQHGGHDKDTAKYPMKELDINNALALTNGKKLFKLDSTVLEDFIKNRSATVGGTTYEYKTGMAILYCQMVSPTYIKNSDDTNKYTVINYPTVYNTAQAIDYNYQTIFYIDDGVSIDYGYVDMHAFDEDLVVFDNTKLWIKNGNKFDYLYDPEDNDGSNLKVDAIGMPYNEYYNPIITQMVFDCVQTNKAIRTNITLEQAKVSNHLLGTALDLRSWKYNNSNYPGFQYTFTVTYNLTTENRSNIAMDYSNKEFAKAQDVIYVTNNVLFKDYKDFNVVNMNTNDIDITDKATPPHSYFGINSDVFYFATAKYLQNIDVYVGTYNSGTQEYEGEANEKRQISSYHELYDIRGKAVFVFVNASRFQVYVLYQDSNVYGDVGSAYFAF